MSEMHALSFLLHPSSPLFSDFILLLAVRNLSQRLYGAGLLSPPQVVILLTQTLSYFSILIIRRQ